MRLGLRCLALAGFVMLTLGAQSKPARILEYPRPDIREEQQVVVNGVAETWQLKWKSPPKPECEPSEGSLSCPCDGFAYGEGGDLVLVRMRNGAEIDRLDIAPLFKATEKTAILQRWEPNIHTDFKAALEDDLPALAAKRPVVKIMHFADYDHDGQATEFYLQTEAEPCGKSVGVLIGLSATNSRLHAVGKASKPNEPVYLKKYEWNSLRTAKAPIEVTDWNCGDHGAETETRLRLHWTPDGVDGTRREFSCPPGPQHLLSETPL